MKPKSDSVVSPFRESQLDQERKVIHKITPVSPVHHPPLSELREIKPAAETGDPARPPTAESKEERQWREMKLRLDDLPGILARLSKIKLTGTMGCLFTSFHPLWYLEFFSMLMIPCMFFCDNVLFGDTKYLSQFHQMCAGKNNKEQVFLCPLIEFTSRRSLHYIIS